MPCILLSNDLVFGAQATAAAQAAGYQVRSVTDIDELVSLSADARRNVRVVLADLAMSGFDAQHAADQIRSAIAPAPCLIAVGPHVHRARLDAARQSGWRVYTRGQFHASAASLLHDADRSASGE